MPNARMPMTAMGKVRAGPRGRRCVMRRLKGLFRSSQQLRTGGYLQQFCEDTWEFLRERQSCRTENTIRGQAPFHLLVFVLECTHLKRVENASTVKVDI
jgi:hypothetical protein